MKQLVHLAPFGGLNPTNVAEEAGLEGTSMRGGYNVETIDAEWWVRHGLGYATRRFGTVCWRWLISEFGTSDFYLVSGNYVLKVGEDQFESGVVPKVGTPSTVGTFEVISVPYPENATVDITSWSYGSDIVGMQVTAGGPLQVGDCFRLAGTTGEPDHFYRMIEATGTAGPTFYFRLDRPLELLVPGGATVKGNVEVYNALTPGQAYGGIADIESECGCVLFEQTATYAAATLGYANVAVNPGQYIIIVRPALPALTNIVAVPIFAGQAVVQNFCRETQLPAPTAVTIKRMRPCVYKDRLFVVGDPPTSPTNTRTVWFSRPFDFMQWHNGLQGLGGVPNFLTLPDSTDPISGLAIMGDTLIVHRRLSQDVVQPYGLGFRATHNPFTVGFWPPCQFVYTPLGHIGWTQYGPAVFSGEGMNVLFPAFERMLAGFWQGQRYGVFPKATIHDANRRRIYFILGYENIGLQSGATRMFSHRLIRQQDARAGKPDELIDGLPLNFDWYSRNAVFTLDYARNEGWLEDHVGISGGGEFLGQMYLFRYDGSICPHPTGYSGLDVDANRTNSSAPVDAQVETQWLAHGTPQRKNLTKIELFFRALDVTEDVDPIIGDKFNPKRISDLWTATTDTLHLCTLEIMVDDREDVVKATADVSVSVAEMLARSLEGNRMLPIMPFVVTPRCSGKSFKYRFKNMVPAAAAAAGHKQGSFRLVDALIEFEVEESTRMAGATGGVP